LAKLGQPIGKRDRFIGPYNRFTAVSWQFKDDEALFGAHYQRNVRSNNSANRWRA
jgi:hypothetical protein